MPEGIIVLNHSAGTTIRSLQKQTVFTKGGPLMFTYFHGLSVILSHVVIFNSLYILTGVDYAIVNFVSLHYTTTKLCMAIERQKRKGPGM